MITDEKRFSGDSYQYYKHYDTRNRYFQQIPKNNSKNSTNVAVVSVVTVVAVVIVEVLVDVVTILSNEVR